MLMSLPDQFRFLDIHFFLLRKRILPRGNERRKGEEKKTMNEIFSCYSSGTSISTLYTMILQTLVEDNV